MRRGWRLSLAVLSLAAWIPSPLPPAERLRLFVETDAGGDPDDEQSLVRFLLYASEWDLEGLIANRPQARDGENLNRERSGLGIVRAMLRAYGECHPRLVLHDARFPKPEELLARTVPGDDGTEAGVELLIHAVDSTDPRPLWYSDWGTDRGAAKNNLYRALDRVLKERGPEGYARFKRKLRLASHENFGEHTHEVAPPFPLWIDTFRPPRDGKRWYHRFSALTATAGGFDLERDLRRGHGPLGALYPTNTTHRQKEGDSMTFLYLIPTGMNDPLHPGWGSWAGRYGRRDDELNPGGRNEYYWAGEEDSWNGSTSRDNVLARWATDLQNDFRARADWCVADTFAQANHAPRPVVNGVPGEEVLLLRPKTGSTLRLDAGASRDPDPGQELAFQWILYSEAGDYRGALRLEGENRALAEWVVPADAAGKSIHLILRAEDNGAPPLARYRRILVAPRDPRAESASLEPLFAPPPEFAEPLPSLRSPLRFDDGKPLQNVGDWPKRRAEILRAWTEILGPWPPLLDAPALARVAAGESVARDGFRQQRLELPAGPEQTFASYLLVPDGAGPFPAVLVVYYEPETSIGRSREPLRDFALELARRGFVTLAIGSPGGDARRPELRGAVTQPLSYHAYVAANCWSFLASLKEVDAARIGILGHSYGGKWALFAAALWEKFAAVAVSDPGIVFDESRPNVNYWEPWYLGLDPAQPRPKAGLPSVENPRTGAYKRLVESGRDLHELHALIAPRPFFVSGGSEDPPERWRALAHGLAVNRLLGVEKRIAMANRSGHTPTEGSNAQIYAFFERFLGSVPQPASR